MNIEAALKNLDNPIHLTEEDLLQRGDFVKNLCRTFQAASPNESAVFALHGEWGSGKTSAKNLLLMELKKGGKQSPIPIEFNPWAFSGQDQVLEAFFTEIGKALGRDTNGKEASEGFKKLGAYLSFGSKTVKALHLGMDLFGIPGSKLVGLVGESLEGGARSAKDYGENIETAAVVSLEKVQSELIAGLTKLKRSVFIILDDLDRLTPDQLLVLFQIVKQNANLPGVNYLLLMDINTITERLNKKDLGPEYIEKIVQFDFRLPHISGEELKTILREGFKSVMGEYSAQIRWERWEEAWINGAQNLFTTLRRIKRFLHTLRFHINFFENDDVLEVDPVDLFLIETVRKFAPETYSLIPCGFRDAVIFEDNIQKAIRLRGRESKEAVGGRELAELLQAAPETSRNPMERILNVLFPQIADSFQDEEQNDALRDARICHPLYFDSYFRLAIPRQLISQQEIVILFANVGNQPVFRANLMELYKKVGLSTLLHRIYCHREKLDKIYLSFFLSELWWLEEDDAIRAGVEKDWSVRENAQTITRAFLKQFSSKSNRCQVVIEALTTSKVFYPLTMIWARENHLLGENPNSLNALFDKDDLEALRPEIIKSIHIANKEQRLLVMPDLALLLYMWRDLEGNNAVEKWLKEQVSEMNRLPKVLASFINKTTISGHEVQIVYSMRLKELEPFFDVATLEPILSKLNTHSMGRWEKFAVEETLKRIAEKRRGVEEADYFGRDESGEDGLRRGAGPVPM